MTLPLFYPILEDIIDTDGYSPLLKSSSIEQNEFGGSIFKHYFLPGNTGGTVVASSHIGNDASNIYRTSADIKPHMALIYDSNTARVTPSYSQAITSINKSFNFIGVALTTFPTNATVGAVVPVIVQTSGDVYVYYDATGIFPIKSGNLVRTLGDTVTVTTTLINTFSVGDQAILTPGETDFASGTKTIASIIDGYHFTYTEAGSNTTSTLPQIIRTPTARTIPIMNDFMGPSEVIGTVTSVFDGYSPVFGYAVEPPITDPLTANLFQTTISDPARNVGLIRLRIQPFYGFIQPLASTITNFVPASGIVGSTFLVTGAGFLGATLVRFNQPSPISASFNVVSNNQIIITVPAGSQTGTFSIVTGLGTTTSGSSFTVLPSITNVTAVTHAVGAAVTISGHTFTNTTDITFGGISQPTFTIVSDISITTTIPVSAITGSVIVTTPDGSAEFLNFLVVPPPTISSIAPTTGPKGTLISITGTGFSAPGDHFDGYGIVDFLGDSYPDILDATRIVYSDTQISAVFPDAGSVAARGYLIRITTDGGTTTGLQSFTYISKPAFLLTDSFTPVSGSAGELVTINGQWGFTGLSSVYFDGYQSPIIHFINDTQITAVVPTTPNISPNVPIRVTCLGGTTSTEDSDAAGTGQQTSPQDFTILLQPIINNFTPSSGATNVNVIINGNNLSTIDLVFFTSFNAVANIGQVSRSGSTVSVTTTANHLFSNGERVLVHPSNPSLPDANFPDIVAQITVDASNQFHYTQSGSAVSNSRALTFNDTKAGYGATINHISNTQISVQVPVSSTNITNGPITVSSGNSPPLFYTSTTSFIYLPAPTFVSINKTSGGYGIPPTQVIITGTHLLNSNGSAPLVKFGSVTASVPVFSTTSITTIVPNGANNTITLTTDGGSFSVPFHVVKPPTITSSLPTSSCYKNFVQIDINGNNFVDGYSSSSTVYFFYQNFNPVTPLSTSNTLISVNSSELYNYFLTYSHNSNDISFVIYFFLYYDSNNGYYSVASPQTFTDTYCLF